MKSIIAFLISIIMLLEALPVSWVPTLEIDASKTKGEVSTKATGFLYGLAEEGVPSEAMTNSLDISSVSQKVIGGLQHPTGDIDNVSSQLEECDYRVVYLQDTFDTWYYCYDEIMEMRKNGTYDWKSFLYDRYLPIVEEKVRLLSEKDYAEDIVYCIFNECDNAVWFGNYVDGNLYYDEIGKANFYEAWKITFDLVKSINSQAKIGGPGFCDYVTEKQEGFMTYCKENNCVPEIMIYHELAFWSIYDWENHVSDYRRIEKELNISPLPIIVTEYGSMEDCGDPSKMIHYITAIENTGTWANMAFWRLANNLNDTCADDNSPNSNWWLYRKYAEMEGQLLETNVSALKESHKHDGDWRLTYKGIASITDEKDEIKIICAGSENKRAVEIKNLDKTNLGSKVDIKIECVYYKGLSGIVSEPIVLRQYSANSDEKLNINIPATDSNAVYFISVTPHDENSEVIRNTNIPKRYEFENGVLLGNAYTYDSAYATTGETSGMVGGMENHGDGVRINISVASSGIYNLDVIFGKHNDSGVPHGRDNATVNFTLDGKTQELSLPNTIKSEYTDCKTLQVFLSAGIHTLQFTNNSGTFVLDSVLVSKDVYSSEIEVLEDSENNTAFLAVAPSDSYYKFNGSYSGKAYIDNCETNLENGSVIYLRRGLNEIRFEESVNDFTVEKTGESQYSKTVSAKDFSLSGSATLETDKYGRSYISNISSEGGSASATFKLPKSGFYRVTLSYANNNEGGVHSYNVDLIESYLTVTCGEESKNIFARNTYSKFTYKTLTFDLYLEKGENEIVFSNNGKHSFNGKVSFAPQIEYITINSLP
ncbi:MAG: hypothetical protein IJ262_10540 [Clostridia bacterium]|nr:hypothetical protein [Clostridia bacterium]MBQ8029826.1 hypothetical protein [Clostridia bacterium]